GVQGLVAGSEAIGQLPRCEDEAFGRQGVLFEERSETGEDPAANEIERGGEAGERIQGGSKDLPRRAGVLCPRRQSPSPASGVIGLDAPGSLRQRLGEVPGGRGESFAVDIEPDCEAIDGMGVRELRMPKL